MNHRRRTPIGAAKLASSATIAATLTAMIVAWTYGCTSEVSERGSGGGGAGAQSQGGQPGGGNGQGGEIGDGTCANDSACDFQERCEFEDGLCGGGVVGTCASTPGGCSTGTGPWPMVCGCDGSFHNTDCLAFDGTDRSEDPTLCGAPPPGLIQCGSAFCQSEHFYCEMTPDGGELAGACTFFPDACRSCDCFTPRCAGGTCDDSEGYVVITCP